MKKISMLLALVGTFAFGQIEITQNNDTETILSPHAVTCGAQGQYTSFNQFSRSFYLYEYGIEGDFNVTSVKFGVESITGELPFFLTLSTTSGYPYGDMEEVAFEIVDLNVGDVMSLKEVMFDFPVVIPDGTEELVMAFEADGEDVGISWYPASNNAGDTYPNYIMAPSCDIDDPTTMADIGFANINVIMVITGEVAEMGTVELGSRAMSIYPNPATDVLNVKMADNKVATSMEVVNLAGQTVLKSEGTDALNVNFLAPGNYILRVKDANGTTHMNKFIKK